MATKAADFLQKEGPDKAFAAFNAGGDWREKARPIGDKSARFSVACRGEVMGGRFRMDQEVLSEVPLGVVTRAADGDF